MPTVTESLAYARRVLHDCSDSPSHEARRLLAFTLNQTATWLYTYPDTQLTTDQAAAFETALEKRATGYPLAYILGEWGFYKWDFVVNEHVLIPRPETERLIEIAEAWASTQTNAALSILDVGTGSGAIAVSLALLLPEASVLAVDMSREALEVANINAQRLNTSNITFLQSDLLTDVLPQRFDLIAANLPYIDSDDLQQLAVAKYEPQLALDGGPAGMIYIERLLHQTTEYVKSGSMILLEIGDDQGQSVLSVARGTFPKAGVDVIQDLNGRDRIVRIQI